MPIPTLTPPATPEHVLLVAGPSSTISAPTGTCTRMSNGNTLCLDLLTPFLDAAAALRTAGVDPSALISFYGPSGDRSASAQLVDINSTPRAGNGQ